MIRLLIIFIFCMAILPFHGRSQDFTFSQFYEQPLLRNPALAGVFRGDLRVSAAHRNQWGSVTVPFKTTAVSVESKFPLGSSDDFLTAGVQMSGDIAGDIRLKRTQLLPAINFHKSLSGEKDEYLSLAFMGGISGNQFDPTKMRLADQWRNGEYSSANPTMQVVDRTGFTYWDASTGISYSSSIGEATRYYAGAALYHFNKPKVAFSDTQEDVHLQERWTFNGGINAPVSENGAIMAFADYMMQGGHRQLLAGVLYGTDLVKYYGDEDPTVLYMGAFLRWGDALMPVVRLEMKNMGIALSYDVNISKLHVASHWRGGLELTASYRGFLRTRNSTLDRLRCVRF